MPQLRWPRTAPWDEAFFLEWVDTTGVGWWFRWTLSDGVRPRLGVWAMGDDGLLREGARRELPLKSLQAAPGGWIAGDGFWFGPDRATGSAGRLSWDLALKTTEPTWRSVPVLLETFGVGRTYEPLLPGVWVEGTVVVDGVPSVVRGRGTAGHLFGAKNRLARWAWVHASDFGEDVVFEVLSAQVGTTSARPMTSVHLRVGDRSWTLSGLIDLVRTRAALSASTLTVRATHGSVAIEATMTLPVTPVVARYEDPSGAASTCRNSTRCTLAVRVIDRRHGIDRAFRTERAIGEIGTRGEPDGPATV